MTTISNIITKNALRTKQQETLKILADALGNSFGPNGSNTQKFLGPDYPTIFTKDGHNILSNIRFAEPVEESVRRNIEEATRYITKTVGDGTTSVVILSNLIFKELNNLETTMKPYDLMRTFSNVVKDIQSSIRSNAKPIDLNTIYDICMISTNGNKEVSNNIKSLYEKHGFDLYISLETSTDENTYIKTYDGMTIEVGYGDPSFINNPKTNSCSIRNPRIYAFQDPVDTKEMINFFNLIITNNIVEPLQKGQAPIPTVIFAPKISRDMNSYLVNIIDNFYQYNKSNSYDRKPPFLFVTDIPNLERYSDIVKLCGCKIIQKYIDLEVQQADIENGIAPTPDTIYDFYGTCDLIECDAYTTKIINPGMMFEKDEKGNNTTKHSHIYNELLEFLENQLEFARKNNLDSTEIYKLRKRIGSLKANMIEYMVGGVSSTERDALKDLLDDAIKNCKSAVNNGYGYASNLEALFAIKRIEDSNSNPNSNYNQILKTIKDAYLKLISTLYSSCLPDNMVKETIDKVLEDGIPYNLRTGKYDKNVVTSIETDIIILEVISKIVTLMFTSNQFLVDKPVVAIE